MDPNYTPDITMSSGALCLTYTHAMAADNTFPF